jgi:hypothetical protein
MTHSRTHALAQLRTHTLTHLRTHALAHFHIGRWDRTDMTLAGAGRLGGRSEHQLGLV